jgi:cyclic-di-AMP phosphodiesterase PgpH
MKPLTKLRVKFSEKTGFSQNTNLQRSLVALVIFFIVIFILTFSVMPHRVSLEVGKPSPQTITAQREVVDFYTTSLLKDEAAAAIPETFDFDPGTLLQAEEGVSSFFAQVLELKEIEDAQEKKARAEAYFSGLPYELPENAAAALLQAEREEVQGLEKAVAIILQDALEQGIKSTGLENAHRQVTAEVNRQSFSQELLATGEALVLHFVRPNLIYNHEVTEKAREEARQAVEPLRILKGALIVTEGEQVTETHIGQLEALGLQRQGADYAILMGLCIMLFIIFTVIGIYLLPL